MLLPALTLLAAALLVGFFGPLYRPRCPDCKKPASRVIHMGVPMWMCFDAAHRTPEGWPGAIGIGFLSALLGTVLPWNGWFCVVPGPYLPGLFVWWHTMGCDKEHR